MSVWRDDGAPHRPPRHPLKPPLWKSVEVTPTQRQKLAAGPGISKCGQSAAAEPAWGTAALSRAAPAQQQHRAALWPTPQPAPSGMQTAISAAPPTAFNEAANSEAMASRTASLPALLMLRAIISDQCTASNSASTLLRCLSGPALAAGPSCRLLGSYWPVIVKPARWMARDANEPPGRSHGSPVATRAAARGAFVRSLRARSHAR